MLHRDHSTSVILGRYRVTIGDVDFITRAYQFPNRSSHRTGSSLPTQLRPTKFIASLSHSSQLSGLPGFTRIALHRVIFLTLIANRQSHLN